MPDIELNFYPEDIKSSSKEGDAFEPAYNTPNVPVSDLNMQPSANGSIMTRDSMQSPNFVTGARGAGWQIKSNGDATFQNVTVNDVKEGGVISITVIPGDNLQKALDDINTEGGGTLLLSPGTYTVTTDLNVYDSTTIQGDSNANTIIDFNNNSKSIKWTGTDIYTTGTIASTSGTTVNGSGTTWTSDMVGRHILMDERWYKIVGFTNTTTIIIESAYQDGASFSGAYRIVNVINNVAIKDVLIKNSGTTALIGIDILDVELEDVVFLDNNKGFDFDNFSRITSFECSIISSTSNGFELTQGTFFNGQLTAAIANGGHGAVLNNIKSCTFLFSAANSNTTDGYNCTDVTNCLFKPECSSNGGQGIEFVSGCNNNFIDNSLISNNTSDGIKLTATSDNNTIGNTCNITSNGGYGVNIAASTCDNNTVMAPYFVSNTSGEVNDSGTGTTNVSRQSLKGNLIGTASTVTVGNTVTETNLFSFSVLGGTLSTNSGINAKIYFSNFQVNGNNTCTIRIKYGATTIASFTIGDATVHGPAVGSMDIALISGGTTSSQRCSYEMRLRVADDTWSTNDTGGTGDHYTNIGSGTAAEDSTGALNFIVSVQWSATGAGNTLTMSDTITTSLT